MQRFAICNEVFEGWPWERFCGAAAAIGYQGVEIAPFTLAEDVASLTPERRREIRRQAADAGLEICGLHWLLVSPPGLHIHSRDEAVRGRTVDYLRRLIAFAGDMGAPVMVFGSPRQRTLEGGDAAGARSRMADSFRAVLPDLHAHGVTLCQEALPECDFIRTMADAAALVSAVDDSAYALMLDMKSLSAEAEEPAVLAARYLPQVHHVHANDASGRAPGMGETDFLPLARVLTAKNYAGYVSAEPFDYQPDPETVARQGLEYLQQVWQEVER